MNNHRTWVEISESAIVKNLKDYEKLLPQDTMIMAVVKANAYGHDLEISSNAAIKAGVDYLAVFEMADAVELRKTHKEIPILVLKQIDMEDLETALKNKIDITVSSLEVLKKVAAYKNKSNLLINLKIDTGLSRQGLMMSEIEEAVKILNKAGDINIVSIYSHLIGAENKKFDSYTKSQIKELNAWQNRLNEDGFYPLIHTSATSGFLRMKELAYDAVRIGIGMYGLWPSQEVKNVAKNKLSLNPALSWKTKIEQVKTISAGKTVAYDATFKATKATKIAILPIGYWDGLPRTLSSKGHMLCGGKKCKILGRVMMNMCVIDVSSVPNVKAGDPVVIIGKQKSQEISAEEVAEIASTINYEIVTRINALIPRIAIK